jgi:Ser/Thr protein kinase RdoA (MazF antagonist)
MTRRMKQLEGGRTSIVRVGNRVHRPASRSSAHVHDLLRHVHAQGFHGAPVPLGFDEAGNEVVSFLPGDVCSGTLTAQASSHEALCSAARLLRSYHEATLGFSALFPKDDEVWMLRPREPREVMCHGDFAPYNVVLHGSEAVGIIDFDTVHPGPRSWDIAYALYRWAPLAHPDSPDGLGTLTQKVARAALFCAAYGLAPEQRHGLAQAVVTRLEALVDFMKAEAQRGHAAFVANLRDGHHLRYEADIAYLTGHRHELEQGLVG